MQHRRTPRTARRGRSAALLAGFVGALLLPLPHVSTGAHAVQEAPTTQVLQRSDSVERARGTHRWKVVEAVVPTRTGPDNDLPVAIDTRLYVPDNASRRTPQPAIVMTHGFGLTKDSTEILTTARFFAAHGYHVLTFTSAGFGASGGCVTLQSADYDVKSARQVIAKVLGTRKDVLRDRRGLVLGTVGGSYGGGIQLPLAAAEPQIRAAIPGRTWGLLAYSLDPNNRIAPGDPTGFTHALNEQGVFKREWTSLFYALGNAQPAQGNGGCPELKAATADPQEVATAAACPGYFLALCRTYTRLATTGDAGEEERALIDRASGATYLSKIRAAVLLVQGQRDTLFNVNEAVSTFLSLRARDVPVGMIWNSGGHGGYASQPGECEAYDGVDRSVKTLDDCYLSLRQLGWMDHFLRGTKGGRGPAFAYHRDWVRYSGQGANDEQYGAAARFPLTTGTRFTLQGDDALVGPGTSAFEVGSVRFVNPPGGEPAAYSETSQFTGPQASPSLGAIPAREIPGQHAAFTSRPFARAVDVVGVPRARLQMSHVNGQDLVFFAKVYDVAPDGSATLIHRLIAPVRVPADQLDAPVKLNLVGFAHRFRAGHSVRLVVAATDATSSNSKVADAITIETGKGSTFTLPTLSTPSFR